MKKMRKELKIKFIKFIKKEFSSIKLFKELLF